MSSYTLFIGNNCLGCKQILDKLKKLNINITVVNIHDENPNLPFPLMIVPALIKDDRLIAYGIDIVKYLKTNYY
ncbi:MAG: hypothetical protein COW67_00680 [Flavobacteriales bacterium CG18_big_fil_WC_8_21_14_2_50_32_9]|nr:MAG: hypothetical protein COW67_00680 [Flavobacteriales bacterium CG18_big_fil_WC_8_21_14_2_50_32_9]